MKNLMIVSYFNELPLSSLLREIEINFVFCVCNFVFNVIVDLSFSFLLHTTESHYM